MIRSYSLALLVLCLGATPAAAQAFGVVGGIAIATQTTSDDAPLDPRIGLVAGGFVRMPLASWLDLQAEGLYLMKGARLDVLGVKSTLLLDYVEIPVLARVRLGGGHRYFVAGGPSTGLLVRAKGQTRFSGSTEELDLSDEVERVDFGIAAGGGVEIKSLIVDARYTFGLRDIDKAGDSTAKNRVVSITAGFRF